MAPTVTVWNENVHEQEDDAVADIYPDGIHGTIADALADHGFETETATLQDPEHGLTEDVPEETDVLVWWSHIAQDEVEDAVAERVADAVRGGMGLIVLHSAVLSTVFRSLMGTTGTLKWREADERERLWVTEPTHPIAEGVDECIELEPTEMYGEPFDVPTPDSVVFTSWFEGGEVFRSGCCWQRGRGKIFFFRPGHETHPIYHDDDIQRVLANAAEWAAPDGERKLPTLENVEPRERIGDDD